MKNKIGWCNLTFNPVWGCLNNCEYCYARRIAGFRYNVMADKEYIYMQSQGIIVYAGFIANRLRHFAPTFIESNFMRKFPKKPQRIFVGSMSEIKYWKKEWMERVLEKMREYPQHVFQFLTKFLGVYLWYKFPVNCWLGITITDTKDYDYLEYQKFKTSNPDNLKFVCFEPLLNEISINLEGIGWVILGAETGDYRKGKIIPKREWIKNIVDFCRDNDISVYLKNSLKEIYPVEIKEFPEVK